MSAKRELLEFSADDPADVIAWLEAVLHDGMGDWINLEPVIDDKDLGELTVRRGVMGWFSGRGSDLPFATVVGADERRRSTTASLGLQHGAGPKAARILADVGIDAPAGWHLRQDHPKRGLVYQQDGSVDAAITLDFVVASARALGPTTIDDAWSAVLHRSRG